MGIYRKFRHGVWYYDVTRNGVRKRGSTGTKNRDEAELISQTISYSLGKTIPRDRVLRVINALYDVPDKPDLMLSCINGEVDRLDKIAGCKTSEHTKVSKHRDVNRFVKWAAKYWQAASSMRKVDRICAQAFATYLVNKGLAAKTRWNIIGNISSSWNSLKRGYDDIVNPWPLAAPKDHSSEPGKAFTVEQVRQIIAEADNFGYKYGLACRIAASTGLRRGDVCHLQYEDIVDGVIRFMPNKTKRHRIEVYIPLPEEIVKMIGTGTGYIMPDQIPICEQTKKTAKSFSTLLDNIGIDSEVYTFHSFRHYFRTMLSESGISEETAMKLGGWTQVSTARRYDHAKHESELRHAVNLAWEGLAQCQ